MPYNRAYQKDFLLVEAQGYPVAYIVGFRMVLEINASYEIVPDVGRQFGETWKELKRGGGRTEARKGPVVGYGVPSSSYCSFVGRCRWY